MMFTYEDCVTYLKYLATHSDQLSLSHCQKLDAISQDLGFSGGYNDFRNSLRRTSERHFSRIANTLAKRYCSEVQPSPNRVYYLITIDKQWLTEGVGFISKWIGFTEAGNEIRVPRPLRGGYDQSSGKFHYEDMRRALGTHYVIENRAECYGWMRWLGHAYLTEQMVEEHFPFLFDGQVQELGRFGSLEHIRELFPDQSQAAKGEE